MTLFTIKVNLFSFYEKTNNISFLFTLSRLIWFSFEILIKRPLKLLRLLTCFIETKLYLLQHNQRNVYLPDFLFLTQHLFLYLTGGGCLRGVIVKAMDCRIVVSEFELHSRYYVHFRANTLGKGMNPLILLTMG